MNEIKRFKPSGKRVVICSILAFILGLLQPFAMMFQVMLPMPGISIAMILSVVLYAYAGMVPFVLLLVVGACSSMLMLGFTLGAMSLLLWIVPAIVLFDGIRKNIPFFTQLLRGLIASLGITAIVVILLGFIFGGDFIALFIEQFEYAFEAQKELIWEMVLSTVADVESALTFDEFVSAYYSLFAVLQSYYEYYLFSNLLCGAAISALLAVLWGNWLKARRGDATIESYKSLSEWYLPANTTYGLLLILAASFILYQSSFSGAQTTWIIVSNLCLLAFMVQAFAALDRRMRRGGMNGGGRTVVIVLIIIMGALLGEILGIISVYGILGIVGCASALFGSKGALRPKIDKMKNKSDG